MSAHSLPNSNSSGPAQEDKTCTVVKSEDQSRLEALKLLGFKFEDFFSEKEAFQQVECEENGRKNDITSSSDFYSSSSDSSSSSATSYLYLSSSSSTSSKRSSSLRSSSNESGAFNPSVNEYIDEKMISFKSPMYDNPIGFSSSEEMAHEVETPNLNKRTLENGSLSESEIHSNSQAPYGEINTIMDFSAKHPTRKYFSSMDERNEPFIENCAVGYDQNGNVSFSDNEGICIEPIVPEKINECMEKLLNKPASYIRLVNEDKTFSEQYLGKAVQTDDGEVCFLVDDTKYITEDDSNVSAVTVDADFVHIIECAVPEQEDSEKYKPHSRKFTDRYNHDPKLKRIVKRDAERTRRKQYKENLEILYKQLPKLGSEPASCQSILQHAIKYIQTLKEHQVSYKNKIEYLNQKRKHLQLKKSLLIQRRSKRSRR